MVFSEAFLGVKLMVFLNCFQKQSINYDSTNGRKKDYGKKQKHNKNTNAVVANPIDKSPIMESVK